MIFGKRANYLEKMRVLRKVTVTEDKVNLTIGYADIAFDAAEIPKLLADFLDVYCMVKPALEARQAELDKQKEKADKESASGDEPINLDDIPF